MPNPDKKMTTKAKGNKDTKNKSMAGDGEPEKCINCQETQHFRHVKNLWNGRKSPILLQYAYYVQGISMSRENLKILLKQSHVTQTGIAIPTICSKNSSSDSTTDNQQQKDHPEKPTRFHPDYTLPKQPTFSHNMPRKTVLWSKNLKPDIPENTHVQFDTWQLSLRSC